MRTTLTIDDEVLSAAKTLAEREKKTVGEVVSRLARAALGAEAPAAERNGLMLLPRGSRGAFVDGDLVKALGNEAP